MRSATRIAVVLALALGAGACRRNPPAGDARIQPALQSRLESGARPAYVHQDDHAHHLWQEARRFYQQNAYRPVWVSGTRARGQLDGLIRALRAADQEGLTPADYGVDDLDTARHAKLNDVSAADLDLQATYSYLAYAWDLSRGTLDPEEIDPHWHSEAPNIDLHAALQNGVDENRIEESLQQLAPATPQYQGLKHQLARHRSMTRSPDVDTRIEKIVLNMDRWRWMPRDLGDRYLIVNVPAYHLDVIENGRSILGMKVVAGKATDPTPVLADRMTQIVFSPYWNIPPDIVQKETAPAARKNPEYLTKNNIEVVQAGAKEAKVVDPARVDWDDVESGELRLRQRPGAGNSLGLVKFVFPNHFNVYLHGTPAQSLFNRDERDLSHGCVRLERPTDLAEYVLRDQPEWTPEKIDTAMHAGTEQTVKLKQPLPVYLVYMTAWEENGDLKMGDDPYGYDVKQQRAAAAEN